MTSPIHRTKIICTLGPATDRPEILEKVILSGMDVARLNAAHGDVNLLRRRLRDARAMARKLQKPLAFLIDLPGPKMRLGILKESSISLRRGDDVYLGRTAIEDTLPLGDPSILRDLKVGDPVYLADGSVRLVVHRVFRDRALCRVETAGTVRSRSGLNLPGTALSIRLPAPPDLPFIKLASEEKAEWLGVSFVRTAEDVLRVRAVSHRNAFKPKILAKIEKPEALKHLSAIASVADALMVARGDLGVETPLAEVPLAQKRIIMEARLQGRPVVTATQMLESMVESPSPTRAEVNDVANAVLDGTDAVMLSAETAVGSYPPAPVRVLAQVIQATERAYPYTDALVKMAKHSWTDPMDAASLAVCRLAMDIKAVALVVSGESDEVIPRLARFRPQAPILVPEACTGSILSWNVLPVPGVGRGQTAKLLRVSRQKGWLKRGETIILLSIADHGHRLEIIRI